MSDAVVLAFGDSLTAGYGLAREQAFSAQLQRRLGDVSVLDAGVSGDTTADGLRRLPRVLARLTRRPDLTIVELGANDLLRGIAPEQSRANLDAILTEFARCGIPVLLATFAVPPILGPAVAARYNGIYPDLAARHGVPTQPFFPPNVMGVPGFVLPDRLHPNAAGIERVADAFAPAVRAALDRSVARAAEQPQRFRIALAGEPPVQPAREPQVELGEQRQRRP
jgi:acyl-CoA thioesterase I